MFLQSRDAFNTVEFNMPVESIMRCEDFKSNFARRLSNRYTSKTSAAVVKSDPLPQTSKTDNTAVKNVTTIKKEEHSPPLKYKKEGEEGSSNPKTYRSMHRIEETALNMEVDTLRWQLAQTEASRQMHIALLKQIVTFLNKVKDHIEMQKKDITPLKSIISNKLTPRSFNATDLPRSRSVVHVNKNNIEYSINTGNKMSPTKISKSISNVHAFKGYNSLWSQSKLSLDTEVEDSQKITEEMTRLINLANTVLSTNLPDLACNHRNKNNNLTSLINETFKTNTSQIENKFNGTINDSIDENITTNYEHTIHESVHNSSDIISELDVSVSLDSYETKNNDNNLSPLESKNVSALDMNKKNTTDKGHHYTTPTFNFIEDESGFSSMSSFQEIGIPIISIIPPSPCKEVEYIEELPNILDETEKWKKERIELDKQSVKVFWV